MGEHQASIEWQSAANASDFVTGHYSREHMWIFDGGVTVPASPSPSIVPVPWSNPAYVDPEEAFVAAVASCHMLAFLYLVAKAGFVVTSYRDTAVGVMAKNERGAPWISKVTLTPRVAYADRAPSAAEQTALHHAAHDGCFIASSIKTEVVVATS
ncbi:MAG: OsmC family protein [Deltaproteobacteria bacterium]|nr:OsmC family protein [Deltaproteobacteria bacterium]MDQ3298113.1 OsmC family protein [Myxococcota bacterium]